MNGSNWTGKVHRTLQSAFGPHTDERIGEPAWHDAPGALILAAATMVLACWAIVSALFIFWSAK